MISFDIVSSFLKKSSVNEKFVEREEGGKRPGERDNTWGKEG